MSIRILGITGPTGAGKSLLSEYLRQVGLPVIDADKVYHALTDAPSACTAMLRDTFGEAILRADGSLNRTALSEVVFHDTEKLALLNSTVLGCVLDEIRAKIKALESDGHSCVAVDAPTLIESGFHLECSTVISVLSPRELRIRRIVERDGISEARARTRVDAQNPDEFYRQHSDLVFVNQDDKQAFWDQIDPYAKEWAQA